MAKYKVQGGQNLYDVALHLFGSVEGVFDLLVSNPKLSLATPLKAGAELEYHEGYVINSSVVSSMSAQEIVPANGERGVYYKQPDYPVCAVVDVPADVEYVSFSMAGSWTVQIDWGDNSPLQNIFLSVQDRAVEHWFDNKVRQRKIRIYGNFELTHLDLSGFPGTWRLVRPMTVDRFTSVSNYGNLAFLFLCKGTVEVNLQNSHISDLSPIRDYGRNHLDSYNGLQTLDLRGARFESISVLDDYLEYIAGSETHGTRRPCTVYLSSEPSERGLGAIERILQEPAWNQEGFASSWKFYIKDKLFTTE